MRPGPAPKPLGLRVLEGVDRRGRAGQKLDLSRVPVVADDDLPVPPEDMPEELRPHWDKLYGHLDRMGLLAGADVSAMVGYCQTVLNMGKAMKALNAGELVEKGERGSVVSKNLLAWEKISRDVLRYSQEFGLTPAARARVEVAHRALDSTPAASDNPFEATG